MEPRSSPEPSIMGSKKFLQISPPKPEPLTLLRRLPRLKRMDSLQIEQIKTSLPPIWEGQKPLCPKLYRAPIFIKPPKGPKVRKGWLVITVTDPRTPKAMGVTYIPVPDWHVPLYETLQDEVTAEVIAAAGGMLY